MYMSLVIAKIAYNCTNLKIFLVKIDANLKITAAPTTQYSKLFCPDFTQISNYLPFARKAPKKWDFISVWIPLAQMSG